MTTQKKEIHQHQIEVIVRDQNSHLFFAISDQEVPVGMITVGLYHSPTGKKAWIEDVVVDETQRGTGIGKKLVEFAIQFAKDKKADTLMLTSNPARISANQLYPKLGFQRKETNVYRIAFT